MAGKLRSGVKSAIWAQPMADCGEMSEQATPMESLPPEGQTDPELRDQLAHQQEEILRLRDLLVRKDAELGAAKGRLAELDDRSQRVANVSEKIESRVPGLGRLIGTAVRLLRSQRH